VRPDDEGIGRVSGAYRKTFARFWWILLLGVLLAGLAGVAVIVNERDQRTFIASTRLLVTSSEAPYYRIGVTDFVEAPQPESTDGEEEPTRSAPILVTDTPDTATLIQAANLYPLLIESDQVELMRENMFGPLAGDVRARAIYAVATPGRFELSDVPVIELTAESPTGGEAIALAEATSKAFIRWISQQQEAGGVEDRERIVVEQLQTPKEAAASGSTPITLVALVALAVVGAFIALAVALDRIFPRKPGPEPERVEKTAPERVDTTIEVTDH
jgi:hypothetical protein